MSFERSNRRLLDARDRREEILRRQLRRRSPATLFLSLNIPGRRKIRAGAAALFRWTQAELRRTFFPLRTLVSGRDSLGPYAVLQVGGNSRVAPGPGDPGCRSHPGRSQGGPGRRLGKAPEAKRLCARIEAARPAARLVDLDVYDARGVRIGRTSLGLPARRCLACARPAAECMRLKRHEPEEIVQIADELLADFRDCAPR